MGKRHSCPKKSRKRTLLSRPKKKVTYVSKKTVLSKQRTVLSYFFELIIKIGEKDTSVTIFEKFEPTKIEALRRTAAVNEH